jgi:ankyrin repeat protein
MDAAETLNRSTWNLSETHSELENRDPISYAAKYGLTDYIRNTLPSNKSERIELLKQSNRSGMSALHLACSNGHLETIDALLELGSPSAKPSKLGYYPIHLIFANTGTTAIEAAFDLFIKHQATLYQPTRAKENLAHLAARFGVVSILKLIKEQQPNLFEQKNNESLTPLMEAILNNQEVAVSYLVTVSNLQSTNKDGQTAQDYARESVPNCSDEVLQILNNAYQATHPQAETISNLVLPHKA